MPSMRLHPYASATLGLLLVIGGPSACSNSEGSQDATSTGGTTSKTSTGETGGQATGGQATGGESALGAAGGTTPSSGSAQGGQTYAPLTSTCAAPKDLGVRIVGRHDGCDPAGVRVGWSGTGFVGAFTGTGVSVRLNEVSGNYYAVVVDGVVAASPVITKAGEGTYVLATGLAAGSHEVQLYRRTEGSFEATTFLEVTVEGGSLTSPPPAPTRHIEVFGDSISCGYGNEGLNTSCGFSADTENHYMTYGSVIARHFGAELSTIAWSGRGVFYNYGGSQTTNRMPALYERTLPYDAKNLWLFNVKTDLIIINLGTNDFSTETALPTDAEFTDAYTSMLSLLRARNPEAYILCTAGPMLYGTALTRVQTDIAAAVAARKASGDSKVEAYKMTTPNTSPGCDWHPTITTHAAMAAELEPRISAALGW